MTTFVALLRAVNVGGTGKLPMSDLRQLCQTIGFQNVTTYIASGNVVFDSDLPEGSVKNALQAALTTYAGKPVEVLVRTGPEMEQVLSNNPFADAAANRTVAIFLDALAHPAMLDDITGQGNEQVVLGRREIYVSYGNGMGRSKLKIPAAAQGTARNMNTVATLAKMANRQ
jgi:uncharacterized protein (DUF1697 family)